MKKSDLILILFPFFLVGCRDKLPEQAEKNFIAEVETSVKSQLKDADSAKFQYSLNEIFMHQNLVCGEVNAKNSFGGYGGFNDFIYDDGSVTFYENDPQGFLKAREKCVSATEAETKKTIEEIEKIDPKAADRARAELGTDKKGK